MIKITLSNVVSIVLAVFLKVVVLANPTSPRPSFEGQVAVDGTPFTGMGQFKFALLTTPESIVWTSTPDSDRDGIPDAPVFVWVNEGTYNIDFVSPLPPIAKDIFDYDLRMRVWFRPDDLHEFQLTGPDLRFFAPFFAFRSGSAKAADSVSGYVRGDQLTGKISDSLIPPNIARLDSNAAFTAPVQAPSFQGALDATNLTGTIPIERIPAKIARLDSSGNIDGLGWVAKGSFGVGASQPEAPLHVKSDVADGTALFQSGHQHGTWLHLRNTASGLKKQWSIIANSLAPYSHDEPGGLVIRDGTQGANRMVISGAGNVGIGVEFPDTTLALKRDNSKKSFGGYYLSLNDSLGSPWFKLGASDKGVFSIGAADLRDYDIAIDRTSGRVGIGGIPDSDSKLRVAGNVLATGTIQAPSFQGLLHATNLTGTIPIERLPADVARLGYSPVFTAPVQAPSFQGFLEATNLTGTILNKRIPPNIARLDSSPVFTAQVQAPSFQGLLHATNLIGTIPIERIPASLGLLDSSGNIDGLRWIRNSRSAFGIGTSTPEGPLHLVDNHSATDKTALFESNHRYGTGLHLRNTSFNRQIQWSFIVNSPIRQAIIADEEPGGLAIRDWTLGTNRMVISSSGNVGIGVAHPDTTLALKRDNANPAFGGYYLSLNDPQGTPWWKLGASDKGVFSIGAAGLRDYDIAIDRTSGRVGIGGIPDTSAKLRVAGDVRVNGAVYQSSDVRLKNHIQPIQNALDKVNSLDGVTFDWRHTDAKAKRNDHRQAGFIAQQVEAVLPELVQSDSDGYLAVNYNGMAPVLVEAIKSLNEKFGAALSEKDSQIRQLEARLKSLETTRR